MFFNHYMAYPFDTPPLILSDPKLSEGLYRRTQQLQITHTIIYSIHPKKDKVQHIHNHQKDLVQK